MVGREGPLQSAGESRRRVHRVVVDLPQDLQAALPFAFAVRHEETPEVHHGFALFQK